MNTRNKEAPENGNPRRKSIGSGGGTNLAGGKTRRYSLGVTSSVKIIGEEGNIIPNYLRASTGSCHDFCKFGKKHEQLKSAIHVKFKRTTVVNKDKLSKTEVLPEKKSAIIKPSVKPEIHMPDKPVTKKDALSPSKKPQAYKQSLSTNRKTTNNEVKSFQKSSSVKVNPEGSTVRIEKKDTKTVKTSTPKTGTVKKVVTKVNPNEKQLPKGSFGKAASLKAVKSRRVKQVSPLKDQNRMMQKTEPEQTVDGVEVESEVKSEITEFDFSQPPMELVNPPVCSNSDSFSEKNVEEELPVIHPVNKSSELFSYKEVVEELITAESSQSQSCSEKEMSKEEEFIAPLVAESPESFYDDEVQENESDYTDDEEAEVSDDGSETGNINEMKTSVENHKIPRKGKMVISEDKDEAVKLKFRRGKVLDIQTENNSPRRLKFRRRVIAGNEDGQNISRKTYKSKTLDLHSEDKHRASRRSFEKKHVEKANDVKNGHESVVLKHQIEQEKKDAQGLLNNVIEETASKLVESRKSKVKALVGAFETVISLQDGKPSSG